MMILKMSFTAAVLILAIVVIRALFLHKLPKKTFLILWGVALCRLLIPFSITSRFSVYTLADMLKDTSAETNAPAALPNTPEFPGVWAAPDMASPALTDTASAGVSPVMVVWLIGLSVCVLFFLVTHLRCRGDYKSALPIDNEFAANWLHEHPIGRKVQIRQSDKIAAPLTYGIFRPVVLLPKTTDWTDETRLRHVLTHEFTHIRRFDILSKWLLAAALCVHWFNPFVWVMYVLANRDIELSCDETVVRTLGETMKSAYALTLIGLEEKKSRLTPLVNNFSKYATEERINAIMKIKKTSFMAIMLALALVIGTVTVFATNAASAAAKENDGADASAAAGTTEPSVTVETLPAVTAGGASTSSPKDDSTENDILTENDELRTLLQNSSSEQQTSTASPKPSPANKDTTAPAPAPANENTTDQEPAPANEDTTFQKPVPINTDPDAYDSSYYDFPVNKNGETYGSAANCAPGQRDPDLISAVGTEGQSGYIRYDEIPGVNLNTREEVAEYVEHMKTLPSILIFNLYDQEGNIIGEFKRSNSYGGGNNKHYDSLEEAREAVANGDY